MKKCCLLLLLCLLMLNTVYAADLLDAEACLTLHYAKDGNCFSDLEISIYRVAEAYTDGTFALIAPFSSYPVNIHDIHEQEQWTKVTTTLISYIVANQVAPNGTTRTDTEGIAHFSHLPTGLYLVREALAENETGSYLFNAFMVYLPTPQADGGYDYEVNANPKCTSFIPKSRYSVVKLWQDQGNRTERPKEVVVEIFRDGVLHETQVLCADNNWSYTWYVSGEDHSQWTVAERDVPEAYKVTIQQNGSVFSITNTRGGTPGKPPQTGDTFSPLPWILTMCLSGFALLLLGLYGRRHT